MSNQLSEDEKKSNFERFVSKAVSPSTFNEITGEGYYYTRLFLLMFIPMVIVAAFLCFGKC